MTTDNRTHTTIPAAPGFSILLGDHRPDGSSALWKRRDPVIAWHITMVVIQATDRHLEDETFVHVDPVTPEGKVHWSNPWAVLYPDGHVFDLENQEDHDSPEDWIAAVNKKEAA
jgi:hypothetical protein